MTWDESELRAALHEGEGQTLSPGHLVALGEARRQRRHDRLRTAAVAAVVTGLLGGGVGALSQLNGGTGSAGSNSANGRKALPRYGADRAAAGAAGSAAMRCPKRPPAVPTPADGAPGSAGPLFAEPVASMTVCGYRARHVGDRPVLDGRLVLGGDEARRVADGLNAASTEFHERPCLDPLHSTSLVFYAETAAGRLSTVVVSLACGVTATNGTAVHYGWTPPADLLALTR